MMTKSKKHPARVVVADDSDVFRSALVRLLAKTLPSVEVIAQAGNDQEALQLVEELAPDVLILDIRMPVMDGIAVLHHLQAQVKNVQVVVLSAHEEIYANQMQVSGATAVLPKGDISRLLAVLSKLV